MRFTDLYGYPVVAARWLSLKTGGNTKPRRHTTNAIPPNGEIIMLNLKNVAIGATLAIASIGAFAQASAPVTPKVDAREAKQQARIDAGVASGQLTAKETNRLDKQQGRIAGAEAKAKSDGTVTTRERRHLARMQDRASANIHNQKHDAQTAPVAPKS